MVELSSINIPCGWEFAVIPKSWTCVSHLRGFGWTPYYSTKISQALEHKRQNPKINGESNTQQSRKPEQAHTFIKRIDEKKKTKNIKTEVKKEKSNYAN